MKPSFKYFIITLLLPAVLLIPRLAFRPLADSCPAQYANDPIACANWISGNAALTSTSNNQTQTLSGGRGTIPFTIPNTTSPWGRLWLSNQLTRTNASDCLYTAGISWITIHVTNAQVTVLDNQTGQEKLFASGINSTASAPWIALGQSYRFSLWNQDTQQRLDEFWVSGDGLSCTPTSVPLGTSQNGTFTLTSNNDYCVGETPTYTITSPSNWANQNGQWTSTFENEIISQPNFTLDSSGSWTASGDPWQDNHIGHWKKTATINGVTKTLEFNVHTCGTSPTSPSTQGDFSLHSNNTYCVGETPTYTITSAPAWANAVMYWTSTGPSDNSNQTANLDSSGNFSGNGWQWTQNDIGHWTKSATINGVTKNTSFEVTNCGTTNQNNSLQ